MQVQTLLGRSPGGGHGKPLQYSCLENPMDRTAWWATVHSVAKSRTQLKQIGMHTCRRHGHGSCDVTKDLAQKDSALANFLLSLSSNS